MSYKGLFHSGKTSESLTHRFAVSPLPQAGEGHFQLIPRCQTQMSKLQFPGLAPWASLCRPTGAKGTAGLDRPPLMSNSSSVFKRELSNPIRGSKTQPRKTILYQELNVKKNISRPGSATRRGLNPQITQISDTPSRLRKKAHESVILSEAKDLSFVFPTS
jgi:hypothetical protein